MSKLANLNTQEAKDRRLIASAQRLAEETKASGTPEELEDGELAWMLKQLSDRLNYYMYAEPLK